VLLESLGPLVFLELQGQKAIWGQLDRKEVQGFKALEAKRGKLEDQVSPVRWDHQEKMVLMEKKEVLGLQDVLVLLVFLDHGVSLD